MPVPQTSPLQRPILRESVYERLRDWIIEGVLQPGEALRDQSLALALGVSRTPVREALRRLEDEGLVQTAKNRWTRVKPITLSETRQIYPIVRALELLALELAFTHITPQHLQAMQQANHELQQALHNQDPTGATQADTRFHQVFIAAAQNPELENLLHHLKLKYRRLEQAFFGSGVLGLSSPQEHQAIIQALEQHNLEAARQALANNWEAP